MRRLLPPLLFATFLSVLYLRTFVGTAQVVMEVNSEQAAYFKVYWSKNGEVWREDKMSRAYVRPGRSYIFLRIGDLEAMDTLRLDPGEREDTWLEIKWVQLRQAGFPPLQLTTPADFSRLKPLGGIAALDIDEKGLHVRSGTDDPQLAWHLPPGKRQLAYGGELLRVVLIYGLVLLVFHVACRAGLDGFSWVPYFMTLVLAVILLMAMTTRYDMHPDEAVHVQAAQYYKEHWLPPEIGDPAIRHTYSNYGVSRLHKNEVAYWFGGKFLQLLEPLHLPPHIPLRGMNVLLWALMLLWVAARPEARLLAVPLLVSPQIWYIFSYFNSEAFALFVAMAIAWQVTASSSIFSRLLQPGGPRWGRHAVASGALLGLFLLCKTNFYAVLLFFVLYLGWYLRYENSAPARQVLRRWGAVSLLGGLVFGMFWASDYAVNGPSRNERLYQARVEYAQPLYSPVTPLEERHVYLQMRERGTDLPRLLHIDLWGEKIFRSSFGVFGYTTISASPRYYNLMRWLGLGLVVYVGTTIMLRGGWQGISLLGITALVSGTLVLVALYSAWTTDFQAQGRYFLPMVPMLAVLLSRTRHVVPQGVLQAGVLAMAMLSLYCFLAVGLAGSILRYGL